MTSCYHCGNNIIGDVFNCAECGQSYCSLHKEPMNHDCNIVKESSNLSPYQPTRPSYQSTTPSYVSVPRTAPSMQDQVNYQQRPYGAYESSSGSGIRGTTDGSFTWHHQEKMIPPNAFDPDSGIEFAGILLAHKSEALHLLIGVSLIYLIGLLQFYSPENQAVLELLGYGWAIFMLAGFFATAFLFHEFGHRQVAKHFGLQTKFRLLSFGMILTGVSLLMALFSLISKSPSLPIPALPGAVVVLGLEKIDSKTGWCKAAGPLVNLVYGTILLIISILIPNEMYPLNILIGVAASLNFMLGLFNMIPLGILDGQNIFKWNKVMYFFLVISLLSLMIFFYANYYNFESPIYYGT
jgi:Zn-dependent protease